MPITLESIEARQVEPADMIAALKQAGLSARTITVGATQITLQPGERYAGLVLTACSGPTEIEAAQDVAADLQDAVALAAAQRPGAGGA